MFSQKTSCIYFTSVIPVSNHVVTHDAVYEMLTGLLPSHPGQQYYKMSKTVWVYKKFKLSL